MVDSIVRVQIRASRSRPKVPVITLSAPEALILALWGGASHTPVHCHPHAGRLEAAGVVRVIPTARAAHLTMDQRGHPRAGRQTLGLPTSPYEGSQLAGRGCRAADCDGGIRVLIRVVVLSTPDDRAG